MSTDKHESTISRLHGIVCWNHRDRIDGSSANRSKDWPISL